MLILLLIYVLKKLKIIHSVDLLVLKVKKLAFMFLCLLLVLMFANLTSVNPKNGVKNILFNIQSNSKTIGSINIDRYAIEETTIYNLNSEINARIITDFNAIGVEKSIFRNDTLVYSSVYREVNKRVKLNHSISFNKGKYLLEAENGKVEIDLDIISQNLMKLFFTEPVGIQKVYSDKYKKLLCISAMGNGVYKIVFPNNSTNVYHYKNGECIMIEVVGVFFKVKLKRKEL